MSEDLRRRLLDSLPRMESTLSGTQDVRLRARRRSRRRQVALLLTVGVVTVLGVLLPLAAMSRFSEGGDPAASVTTSPGPEMSTFSASGMEVVLPPGWQAALYAIEQHPRPTIRMATFTLPEDDDALGSGARALMGPDDVLLSLEEHTAVCPPCDGFSDGVPNHPIESADFSHAFDFDDAVVEGGSLPPTRQDVPAAHAFARRLFSTRGRFVEFWAEFGRSDPTPEVIAEVDQILGSLAVGSFRAPAQPDGTCDQFSALDDPDCPDAIWIEEILAATRFDLVEDDLEVTPYAQDGTASFYIYVRAPNEDVPPAGWNVFMHVDGVKVYGDAEGLVWASQDRILRVSPGPDGDAGLPANADLRDLVRASLSIKYPAHE